MSLSLTITGLRVGAIEGTGSVDIQGRAAGADEGADESAGEVEVEVQGLTGVQVLSLHSDMSIKRGERAIVFTLAEDLEARIR
jgi:hypothetical protein